MFTKIYARYGPPNVKIAAKEVELYQKLILAGKFHASFNVIGALSSRMSGADGLNAQGIKHTKEVRKQFPLAWEDTANFGELIQYVLCGGDFDAFEVTIADAVCDDEALRAELKQGKKIHALFGKGLQIDIPLRPFICQRCIRIIIIDTCAAV